MDIQLLEIKVSFLDEVFNLEVVVDNRPERNNKIADGNMEIVLLGFTPDNKNLVWNKRKATCMLYAFEDEFKALVRNYIDGVQNGYDPGFVHKIEEYITSAWKPDGTCCPMCGGVMVHKAGFEWDDYEAYWECTECRYQTTRMNHVS